MNQKNTSNHGEHGEHGETSCLATRRLLVPDTDLGNCFFLLAVSAVPAVVKQRFFI